MLSAEPVYKEAESMADKNKRKSTSEQDEIFNYEELTDEEDFAYDMGDSTEDYDIDDDTEYEDVDDPEDGDPDDFAEDDLVMHFRPWMIPVFAGMIILAILICIPLWKLSHHDQNNDRILTASTETFAESASTKATTDTQQASDVAAQEAQATPQATAEPVEPTAEPAVTPEAQPTAEPAATPEVQPTAEPAVTEAPYISGDASMTFADVGESVTAKDVTNLRTSPSTTEAGNVIGKLRNGEILTRTGRNEDTGWSRLEYNGQTVYAVSSYLVTDLSYTTPETPTDSNRVSTQDGRVIVFTDCDDYITPKDVINLRTEPSTSAGESTVRTQVKNGTNLHRTGDSGEAGWSRVEYNGEVLYAVTNYVVSGTAPE